MENNKKYWVDKTVYSGIPGCDIYEALRECFHDFYTGDKKHEVELNLNGVKVTFKRNNF